ITGQTRIEMLRQAIDSVSEDVFAVEPDGSLAFANKTFLEHNVSDRPRDVIGEKVFDLNKTLVDKTQWGDWLRSLRENGGSWNFTQDRMSDGQGEAMTFENYSYLIENQLHQELIWVFARDISERLKREDEINSLQYLTNSIINNIPVGLYVKDVADDFKYLFCNRSAFDFLRSGREDVIGKNDFEIFGRSKAEAIRNEDLQLVSDRTKIERTGQVGGASGSPVTYEEVRIYSEKKDGTPLIIGVFWDITSRVALEKELVEAKEKAEESGRLKSAFLANMSHEIRTPLNAIVGFSNIIAETQDMEERRGMYKIVETNNERLLSLINEILDMSKIEAGMLELSSKPVNMRVLCGELLNANLFRCPGNVIFSFDGSSPNLVTRTDPNRLFQVFANLITNAFKFTDSGRVTFGYRLDGPNIVCYVEDTGSGIETDKQDKIFDRFVKGNDFAQGTGLGLPICKVLIEKMGGRIGVESAIGRGTKFVFTIPYVPPVNERAGSGNPDGQKTSVRKAGARKAISGTVTVLVVESEPSDFDLLCDTFGDGIFFVRADSGVEAVTLFEQYRPQLVLLNVAVTDMHCAEVAGIIKEVSPGVPVVAFGDSAPTDCYDDFMAVPWSREQVERLFNKYL
ncbi:MAG: ATP-binding protein, partial [Rikenellaceae bacterium]|nr:ATP-binding protein [Rikenellaceae bacterium]